MVQLTGQIQQVLVPEKFHCEDKS